MLQAHVGRRGVPHRGEVLRQGQQPFAVERRFCRDLGVQGGQSLTQVALAFQGSLPTRFEGPGDQAFLRIHRIVAACRQGDLVGRVLQFFGHRATHLVHRLRGSLGRLQGRRHRVRGHRRQHFGADGAIDPHAPDAHAARIPAGPLLPPAQVAMGVLGAHAVGDMQHAAAPPAPEEPGQQGPPATAGLA